MTRIKRGNVARKKHKKILKLTQGFRGSSSVIFRTANQQRIKALKFSHRDRLQRKRDFRSVWITRINAAIRFYGINYNKFFHSLITSNISLNRKIVAQLSIKDYDSFGQLSHFLN